MTISIGTQSPQRPQKTGGREVEKEILAAWVDEKILVYHNEDGISDWLKVQENKISLEGSITVIKPRS